MYKIDSKALAGHRAALLPIALQLSEADHYTRVTRDALARAGGVAAGVVSTTFGTMAKMRRDLMRYAVQQRNARVVGQGLAMGDPHAQKAPDDLKRAALEEMAQ